MRIRTFLAVMVLIPLLVSCRDTVGSNEIPFIPGQYSVTIEIMNKVEKCLLTVKENGDCSIEYIDRESILFGLKEDISNGCCQSEYNGIISIQKELSTNNKLLSNAFYTLLQKNNNKKTNTTNSGTQYEKLTILSDDMILTYISERKSHQPVSMEVASSDTTMKIQFNVNE